MTSCCARHLRFSVAEESIERPAYLRRKPSRGKGEV